MNVEIQKIAFKKPVENFEILANGQKQEFKENQDKMKTVNWKFESSEPVEISV
jgi:hypothetical protein